MTEALTIVPAGAGSGKTFRIKQDLTRWVGEGLVRPERILAVTFTEAAAGELRGRIRASLLAEGLVEAALAVEQAYVSTLHGLGLRILSEHAFAAGASPRPRALSDAERDLLIRQAMAHAPSLDAVRADLPRFGYRYDGWTSASLEDGFRAALLGAVDLLRGLGDSGAAPRLAHDAVARIRRLYGPVAADGGPLEERLRAAVAALLSAFPADLTAHATSDTARKAFAADFRALRRALRPGELGRDWGLWVALGRLRQSRRGAPTPDGYDALAEAVMTAAGAVATHPGPLADACAHLDALIRGAQEVMARYAAMKREAGAIDYADMICDAERLLRTRPEILAALAAEIDCVIIDEFQDTNPVQFALLWRIAQAAPRVLIVGDAKQSIMGFQGADPRLSAALEAQRPDACAPLTNNWRSDPRLMGLVNALSQRLFGSGYVPLAPRRPPTGEPYLEVLRIGEGRRSRKSRPEAHVAARVAAILDAAGPIADRDSPSDAPLMRPVEPGDVAVLCPTHAQAARYAAALTAEGVPVRISAPGWMDAPAVAAARHALAFVADPADAHAALCFLTLGPPAMPLEDAMQALVEGRVAAEPALAPLLALAPKARIAPLGTLLHAVLAEAGIRDWAAGGSEAAQAHADLLRLEAEADAFTTAHRDLKAAAGFHGAGAQVFLGWLDARRAERDFDRHPDPGAGGRAQGVEIVTWHASKGREWPVTVVVGLDAEIGERPGTLRAEFADFSDLGAILERAQVIWTPGFALKEKTDLFLEDRRAAAEADARRLLYVALTRARDRLVLEWPDFALGKIGDGPGPAHHAEMLIREAGCAVEADGLRVGDAAFPATIIACGAEAPEPDAGRHGAATAPRLRFGALMTAPDATSTPWRSRPSEALATDGGPFTTRSALAGPPLPSAMVATAAERGSVLHRALRVLLARPELRHRLPEATGLDAAAISALAERAAALRGWLAQAGYARLHCETPVQRRTADGAEINGVIDLLAEGPGGWLILDHKSGTGTFDDYRGQLEAYAALVDIPAGQLVRLAIHWIDRGEIETAGVAMA